MMTFATLLTCPRAFTVLSIFLFANFLYISSIYHVIPTPIASITREFISVDDVRNRSLGFEKVFAIGFKGRTDKHDAITVASSLSEFDVTWADAVRFEDIPKKAISESWDISELTNTSFAAWRAHLNLLQYIIDNRIQSALIMEDDADWDWYLKDQL